MTQLHPPGAICIASGELARYPGFTHAMLHLWRPARTKIFMHIGLNVAANFNTGIRHLMADPDLEWAWIMGDDHQFAPDTLMKLLDRQVDIVVPVVARRQPPFIPVIFKLPKEETPFGQFPPHYWHELPSSGLLEIHAAGSAGMLIRRSVLEQMGDPWFETGQMGRDLTNEDTYFCKKAQALGVKLYADMEVTLDHWTPMSLRPIQTDDGQWTVGINLGDDCQVALPIDWLKQLCLTSHEHTKEHFELDHVRQQQADAIQHH